MSARPVSTIAIVGGGIVGWSAAAAIRRKLPAIRVTVVPVPPPQGALADRMCCTLPSIVDFHRDIGLGDTDTIVNAGSGLRLGTHFEGWSSTRADYVHAYGDYGRTILGAAFYQHWLRGAQDEDSVAFGDYCTAAALATENRFLPPPDATDGSQLAPFTYGLQIAPDRYCEMMRAYALHLGAEERRGDVDDVNLREDGFIESLTIAGTQLAADLFVDASGPRAMLRSKVEAEREDWSGYFVADRVCMKLSKEGGEGSELDEAIAFENGWKWQARSATQTWSGTVYSSRHDDEGEAQQALDGISVIELAPGRLMQPWVRNCVAIGDSAVSIEPLEWTNLHLAHSAIDRLVAMMPDSDCNRVELWDYNRQVNAEADRVRDFVLLHYAASDRPEPFWREAAQRPLPPSLQHTLTQWRERGRLPFYEEETFTRDSWAAVLIGQGVIPRRVDPLLASVPIAESNQAMEQLRNAIRAAIVHAPTQSAYLRMLAQQETR